MNARRVVFRREARDDLANIQRVIRERAGVQTARNHIARIRAYCQRFEVASERGTRRDDLRPGIRTVGFERRITIVFAVGEREVAILRIFYGGRDFESILALRD